VKDSLRHAKNDIAEKINEVEDQLKLMDSSGNHNVPVVVVKDVDVKMFRHYFQVHGVVETDQNAVLNPEVMAKIVSIEAGEGDFVTKGKTLVSLDSKVVQNNIAEVNTQIVLAQTIYDKQKSLWDQKIGSEIQYIEAKSNLESLNRKLETLEAQLAMYTIKAPFNGVVDEIIAKVGEMSSPGMPVLRIINLNEVYIKSDVSERYLDKIKIGDTAVISFPSLGINMSSQISRIGNFINPGNRTFKIRFEIKNPDSKLIPNLLAEVNIMDYMSNKTIVIPTKVIQETPTGEEFVFVLKRNGMPRAEKHIVKSGLSYKGQIEILEGLKAGDELIVQGGRSIKDGEIVEAN
jgi:RND family efflux transporter MFP subunit